MGTIIENLFMKLPKKNKYETVSFDIFDTIIGRFVSKPKYIYKLVERIYNIENETRVTDFARKRELAELELWNETKNGAFTLDSIYESLGDFYNKKELDELKRIELDVENMLIYKNNDKYINSIYEDARNKNKIILTSDMYLKRQYLEKILISHNVADYDDIFISGECCASKANGDLFKIISQKYDSIVHIGDNFKSDYISAKKNGIKSCWYYKKKHLTHSYLMRKKIKNLDDDIVYNLMLNASGRNYWESVGYQVLGPLLLGLSSWIYRISKHKKAKVIFLARDGYILHKVYSILYPDCESSYMYISRKSLMIANLNRCKSIRDMLKLIKLRKIETIYSVLSKLGIKKIEGIENVILTRTEILNGKYDCFFLKYYDVIIDNSLEQEFYLKQYCKKMFNQKNAVLFDIGWHGTIQDHLEIFLKRCNIMCDIQGLYFGLEDSNSKNKFAWADSQVGFDINIVPFTRGVFETFFTAYNATTSEYIYNHKTGMIEPNFENELRTKSDIDNIKSIHLGACEFITFSNELIKKNILLNENLSVDFLVSGIIKIAMNPSRMDVKKMGNIGFSDTTYRKLVDINNIKTIRELYIRFIESDWKVGFIKNYLPINISKIFIALNKCRELFNRF